MAGQTGYTGTMKSMGNLPEIKPRTLAQRLAPAGPIRATGPNREENRV